MAKTWTERLDDRLRHRPRVMLLLVAAVFVVVTVVLLAGRGADVILYEAF